MMLLSMVVVVVVECVPVVGGGVGREQEKGRVGRCRWRRRRGEGEWEGGRSWERGRWVVVEGAEEEGGERKEGNMSEAGKARQNSWDN